ncbi:FtsX-like permease family protein [Thermoactinomyces sp. AMNI-1]|uniref:FtsX-like permease family protein n=2 Tax=Thermoactinomyces mirandus TaxID=2756294 RepID=A0A7W2ARE9_9BACL|nr:FtsX-like permease family protein [Thermoactinomyces mirandus]
MASSLRERNREFAVLRALGNRPNQVVGLALLEGIIISLAGGLIGIISGLVFGYHILAGLDANEYLFPGQIVFIQLIISPLISLAAAWIPSIWISRRNLLKALYLE